MKFNLFKSFLKTNFPVIHIYYWHYFILLWSYIYTEVGFNIFVHRVKIRLVLRRNVNKKNLEGVMDYRLGPWGPVLGRHNLIYCDFFNINSQMNSYKVKCNSFSDELFYSWVQYWWIMFYNRYDWMNIDKVF